MVDAEIIEITPAMAEAGVAEFRELTFGDDPLKVVKAIYLMMEIERRSQVIDSATPIKPSR